MKKNDYEKPQKIEHVDFDFSTEELEHSPSLQRILAEVSEKFRNFRSLTPTKYRTTPKEIYNKPNESIQKASSAPKQKSQISFVTADQEGTSPPPIDNAPTTSEAATDFRKTVYPPQQRSRENVRQDTSPGDRSKMSSGPTSTVPLSIYRHDEEERPKTPYIVKEGKRFVFWEAPGIFRKNDREALIYVSIQEFAIYIIFVVSVSIVAFGSFTIIMYYYSIVLSDIFTRSKFKTQQGLALTYREIRTIQQFWEFLQSLFIDTLFFQYFEDKHTMMTLTMEESKLVLLENILIGVPRLRQVRVKSDSCKIPQDFAEIFRSCYDYYKSSTEDKDPYGLKEGSEWTYSKKIANKYEGKISTYGTGGYYLNLTRNYEFSKMLLQNLHDALWIDHGTRAVFIDFTLYTPNVNLFSVVKLVAEFPPSGGVIPSSNFYTLNLLRYVSNWDHVILAFEVVSIIILALYTAVEIRKMIVLHWKYVLNPWNIVDITIVLLGWNLFTVGLLRNIRIAQEMPSLIKTINTDDYANFDTLADTQRLFNTVSAFFVTIVWIKLIKYMMLVKVMYHLLKTVGKCAQELLGLTFILILLLISFALLGYLLFGSQVEEFGTFGQSLISLTILVVGSLDYKKVQDARPFLGPLYFMLFIYFFILIFLCLFVAVIVNGFAMVRFDIMEDRKMLYLKNIFYDFLINFLKCIRLKHFAFKLKEKLRRDKCEENYNIIIDILRRSGFRGKEMNLFLRKYKIEKGKHISEDTIQQIYEEIDGKGQLYIEAVEHEQILNEVDLLRLRVAYSDKMVEELASKVELLLTKITKK